MGQPLPANIITTPPFSSTIAPSTCTAAVDIAKGSASANDFLDKYALGPSSSLTTNLTRLTTALENLNDIDPAEFPRVSTYLTSLQTTSLPLIQLADDCLRESLQIDNSALKAAQDRLDESESRLASIRNPEQHVSYYEGWFPIVRPMTETALFGIFAAAIFMLLLSILIFARMGGVQIDIQIPEITLFTLPPNASYYIYGGLAAGVIGSIIYLKVT